MLRNLSSRNNVSKNSKITRNTVLLSPDLIFSKSLLLQIQKVQNFLKVNRAPAPSYTANAWYNCIQNNVLDNLTEKDDIPSSKKVTKAAS
jgi:hypothetical protein